LEALEEAINLSFGIDDTLFAGIEGVASRANVGTNFRNGCAGFPRITAGTNHCGLWIPRWVNISFHFIFFLALRPKQGSVAHDWNFTVLLQLLDKR
jgi:hypothetical protein